MKTTGGLNLKVIAAIVAGVVVIGAGAGTAFYLKSNRADDTYQSAEQTDVKEIDVAETTAAETAVAETAAESSEGEGGIYSDSPDAAFQEYVSGLSFIQGNEADYVSYYVDYNFETDYSNVQAGYVGYKIADFDNDGNDELLVAEVADNSKEIFLMYEYEGEVKLSDKYEIEDSYLSGDYNSTFCFLYENDGLMRIGLYSDGSVYIAADGAFFRFIVISYKDGRFEKTGEAEYAGSDMEEDEQFMQSARQCGILANWDDFCEKPEEAVIKKTNGERMFKILVSTEGVEYQEEYMPSLAKRHVKFEGPVNFSVRSDGTGYLLANSSEQYLSESDLEGLSSEELRIARNEILARHGRKFKDEELQAYFNSQAWYNGTIEPDDFDSLVTLSDVEEYNLSFIKEHE